MSLDEDELSTSTGSVPVERPESRAEREAATVLDEQIDDIDWSILPEGSRAFRFQAPSGSLAAFALGDPAAPRVVLVPGATGSKEDFTLLAPLLVSAGYYVESYDLAGQFESASAGPPDGAHYDYDLFVGDLTAFIESGRPAHLLGYSFAGTIAQIIAVRRPDLVQSLTLLTTPPLSGQSFRGVRTIGWLSHVLTARAGAGLMIWGITTNKNKVSQRRLAFVRGRFALTRRSSVDDIVGLMRRIPDLSSQVIATGIPVLVATGDHDLWPLRMHAAFAQRLDARLAVYRTGHSPCETAPHQLAFDMLRLFERSTDRAAG